MNTSTTAQLGSGEQAINERHQYLSAIRERLDQLYQEHPNDPRLREQIADEVSWIDGQIGEREWVLDR